MRRAVVVSMVCLALGLGSLAEAKFGMSKTKVVLGRMRPPDLPLLGESVAVEVRSGSPEVTGSYVSLVRGRLHDALRGWNLYRLTDRGREADALVRVTLQDLRAEVRDEVRIETRRVKIGERQEWNEKKKKYETKDVYGDRSEPVPWRIAEGSVSALVEVEGAGGTRSKDAGSSYFQQFKKESGVPPEATTEESLRQFLVAGAANGAVATITYSPDPVEALLAVDGELKQGNHFAERGLWPEALEEWNKVALKGDKEAARLHNVGVGHEALAYRLPPDTPEHRSHLEQARDFYLRAMSMDTGEKYFRDPPKRIEVALSYAAAASSYMAELQQWKDQMARRRSRPADPEVRAPGAAASAPEEPRARPAHAPRGKATPEAARPTVPRKPEPEAGSSLAGSAAVATPLRNGSFESSLAPWTVTGRGSVVEEKGRGRVLEILGGAEGASVRQAVGVDVDKDAQAGLGLDYRVASGEARVRVLLSYADASGRERTSTLEVSGGEGPGGWSSWTGGVDALRPRPQRVTGVRIVVEGGVVRLDNVALTVTK